MREENILDIQSLKKFKTQAPFLRKLLKTCFTKMRKLNERKIQETRRPRWAKTEEIPRSGDSRSLHETMGLTRRKTSMQARAGCKDPGDASSEVSTCMQVNFRQLVKNMRLNYDNCMKS